MQAVHPEAASVSAQSQPAAAAVKGWVMLALLVMVMTLAAGGMEERSQTRTTGPLAVAVMQQTQGSTSSSTSSFWREMPAWQRLRRLQVVWGLMGRCWATLGSSSSMRQAGRWAWITRVPQEAGEGVEAGVGGVAAGVQAVGGGEVAGVAAAGAARMRTRSIHLLARPWHLSSCGQVVGAMGALQAA